MPKRLVLFTLASIAAIMLGGILTVVGIARGPVVLAYLGIALAVIGVVLFVIEFISTWRANKKK